MVLRIEPRTLCVVGKYLPTELGAQPHLIDEKLNLKKKPANGTKMLATKACDLEPGVEGKNHS